MTRAELHGFLTLVDRSALRGLGEALARDLAVRHRSLPQDGLWMLTMCDGVAGEPFHAGELPVAEARIEVEDRAGVRAEGGARLLLAAPEDALAAAICDAVWSGNLAGSDLVAELAASGRAAAVSRDLRRAAVRESTRVQFADLGETP